MSQNELLKMIFDGITGKNADPEQKEREAFYRQQLSPAKLLMEGETILVQRTDTTGQGIPCSSTATITKINKDEQGSPNGYLTCVRFRKEFVVHESQVMPIFAVGETIAVGCQCGSPSCQATEEAVILEKKEDKDNEQFNLCYLVKTFRTNKIATIHGTDTMYKDDVSKEAQERLDAMWAEHKKKKATPAPVPEPKKQEPTVEINTTSLLKEGESITVPYSHQPEDEEDVEDDNPPPKGMKKVYVETDDDKILIAVIEDLQDLHEEQLTSPSVDKLKLHMDYLEAIREVLEIKRTLLNGDPDDEEDELEFDA